jgi:hypothetical protein
VPALPVVPAMPLVPALPVAPAVPLVFPEPPVPGVPPSPDPPQASMPHAARPKTKENRRFLEAVLDIFRTLTRLANRRLCIGGEFLSFLAPAGHQNDWLNFPAAFSRPSR